MFMKHTISRFFRFFLVAALVAAMAGSLLPSKALGQVEDPSTTTVSVSSTGVLAGPVMWTIGFEAASDIDKQVLAVDADDTVDPVVEAVNAETGGDITVQFPAGVVVPDTIDRMTVSVDGMMPLEDESVSTNGQTLTIESPVEIADEATGEIIIYAEAGIGHGPVPADDLMVGVGAGAGNVDSDPYATTATPTVETTTNNAGAVPQWEIEFYAIDGLDEDVSKITVTFGMSTAPSASVPSSIDRMDISVRTPDTGARAQGQDADVPTPGAGLLSVSPTRTSRSITFFTPVGVADGGTATIVISADAGVAHRLFPTEEAWLSVQAGTNDEEQSDNYSVNQYLRFSPGKASRNATVTVTGGGFTKGTAGSILIADGPDANNDPDSTGGTYTVDSSGKLSGSFVASGRTGGGGAITVVDLGSGKSITTTPEFAQLASATPTSDEVALGAPVQVALNDFTAGAAVTGVIAGDIGNPITLTNSAGDPAVTNSSGGGTFSLAVPQGTGTGTKQIVVTGTVMKLVDSGVADDDTTPDVDESVAADDETTPDVDESMEVDEDATKSARFLVTIVSRTLTVSPSSAVPGQAITVSGSGFTTDPNGNVRISLKLGSAVLAESHAVNTDGTFLWTGNVPFNEDTGDAGDPTTSASMRWTASELGTTGRQGTSSGFAIQKRAITLSPSTANPGSTVEVFGSGWGVRTYRDVTSQVTLSLPGDFQFGPFPVSSTGEFQGAFTVPSNSQVTTIKVTAMDNNGGKNVNAETGAVSSIDQNTTGGFEDAQAASKKLRVPTGVVSVGPDTGSTGEVITITGEGFPAQTNLSMLDFGGTPALPVPAPATDVTGDFTVTITVPAARLGGSLKPGAVVITATVGRISGTTSFTIPEPSISISADSARPGDSLTISGTGFSAFANVDSINFGTAPALPVPNPRTDGVGDFSASVIVPTLNPGAYTITVRTGADFTATSPVRIVSATVGNALPPEEALRSLTAKGLLTLAAAAPPGGTEFGAYVPDLAGNTLGLIQPNGVLVLTLNADARISVSGQPAVDVAADTPTFFALGSVVSVEVIE